MPDPVNILCIKWGTRYPASYVNFLHAGVKRHLHRPFRFVCCTDDPTGFVAGIETVPFPVNPGLKRGWPDVLVKLLVTQDGFGGLSGPTLFLDLDVVVMDAIDCFFDYEPGHNCIIHNWVNPRKELIGRRPAVGNSSIFRFEAGKSNYIYETFVREMAQAEDLSVWNTEQAFLTHAMREVKWWPEEWARSYKRHCRPVFPLNWICAPKPPTSCRILVFHGRPDPDEALRGYHSKKLRYQIKAAPWIADHWHA